MSNKQLRQSIEWLLKAATLVATWGFIFITVAIFTQFIMAPWNDGIFTRPDIGTWQRSLNDFFYGGPGMWLVAGTIVLGNIFLALRMVWRWHILPWGFIILNGLFVGLFPALVMLMLQLNDVLFSTVGRGYHLAVIPGIVALLLLTLWFLAQSRLHDRRKRKRQASNILVDESPAAMGRLALEDGSAAWDADWDYETHAQRDSRS